LATHIEVGLTAQLRKKFCFYQFYEIGRVCCIFFDVAYIFFFLIFEIIKLQKLLLFKKNSFRDVTLSRNGPGRDAGHFVAFRDCPGQSGTSGHPMLCTDQEKSMISCVDVLGHKEILLRNKSTTTVQMEITTKTSILYSQK